MPGIRDIAEDAQVSIATVSRVLNGSYPVSDELRARVLSSVKKLGYQPNMVARSLRTRRSFVLGVVIPTIANPFFTDIVRAVEDVAYHAGYVVTVHSSDQNLTKEQRYFQVLRNRMVDGVLVVVADRTASNLDLLTESDIPVVLVDRCLEGATLDSVTVDTRHGAYIAVECLIQRGYRRIGMLSGPEYVSTALEKCSGYRQAMSDHGLPVDDALVLTGDYTEASGRELGRKVLSMPNPPDAVLIANNVMTLGFFTVVKEYGLRVPHDIAFVGFDDRPWASLVVPPITMIDQPTYELGRVATEILLERMEGEHCSEVANRVLRPSLVVRGSC